MNNFFKSYKTNKIFFKNSSLFKTTNKHIRFISEETRIKNKKIFQATLGIALGTLGLTYAAVPLYEVFCQATGLKRNQNKKKFKKKKKNFNFLLYFKHVDEYRLWR